MSRFFGTSNRIMPSEPSDTFYLCMPVSGEFFIEKVISQFSSEMMEEKIILVTIEKRIRIAQEKIRQKQAALLKYPENPITQDILKEQLDAYVLALKQLTNQKIHHGKNATAFISVEDYSTSEANAVKLALKKYPEQTFTLIKLTIPARSLNLAIADNKEISRPNLLQYVETVKTISPLDTKKIITARDEILKERIPDKVKESKIEAASAQIIMDIIDNATEYKKSIIQKPPEKSSPKSSLWKSSRSRRVDIMPTISEVPQTKYFKVIAIDSKYSIAFEEVSAKKDVNSLEPTVYTPRGKGH
jgi:hypothetical protein